MAGFAVEIARTADRQLSRLDARIRRRLETGMRALADDPYRPRPGADIKAMRGDIGQYRLRVGGYRIFYVIDGKTVWVTGIYHRSHAYD